MVLDKKALTQLTVMALALAFALLVILYSPDDRPRRGMKPVLPQEAPAASAAGTRTSLSWLKRLPFRSLFAPVEMARRQTLGERRILVEFKDGVTMDQAISALHGRQAKYRPALPPERPADRHGVAFVVLSAPEKAQGWTDFLSEDETIESAELLH